MSPKWKHNLEIIAWITGVSFAGIAAVLVFASIYVSHHARDWVDDYLTGQFKSDVDLASLRVAIALPMVQVEGSGLALHFEGRKDLPAMIEVNHFTVRTSLLGLLRPSRHIQFIHLDGLHINIPPREDRKDEHASGVGKTVKKLRSVWMDEIVSENAVLKILTTKPGKDPLEFDIGKLILHSDGPGIDMAFRATVTNPTPPGEIQSSGKFGPWDADTPSLTPVAGSFTFDHADLGHFRGIGGILSSQGNYQGVLEKIEVDGTTDTPDFCVTLAGHHVRLTTTFSATVDGTNGDTDLHPVVAKFEKTTLVARGSIEGTAGRKGKTITLDITGDDARIEDLMLFALKEPPTMSGPVRLKTKFVLIPGPNELFDRLNLDGTFALDAAHFTSGATQQRLDNLSKRSEGKPKQVEPPTSGDTSDDVATEMKGNFRLRDGLLALSEFSFHIPGATVQLDGTYNLPHESLDLHGKLEMEAKLSQVTTGFKSFLLKAVDPFFSKKGEGTVLPIKITGSVKHPSYGLDLGH